MKKLLALLALLLISIQPIYAQAEPWNISNFETEIVVEPTGRINVTETIIADFTKDRKRGIIRSIPYRYVTDSGKKVTLDTHINSILDQNNQPWEYTETRQGDFIYLRVGNVDVFYSEPLTYKINYSVFGAINYFEQSDELYWNVTGDQWPVPINSSLATIKIPEGSTDANTKYVCYTGEYGSTQKDCTFNRLSPNSFQFKSDKVLNPGEGLTVALAFDKGLVSKPPINLKDILTYVLIGLPPILFVFLFIRWYKVGRDPRGKGTIMPMYTPPEGLTPSEIGTIIDEKVQTKDITVAIIDLAIRGYIEIQEAQNKGLIFNSKDITLIKRKENLLDLTEFEKAIMDGLFGNWNTVQMSDLADHFYTYIPTIKEKIYYQVTNKGYFSRNPKIARASYITFGSSLLFVPLFAAGFIAVAPAIIFGVAVACGLLLLMFAPLMPQKTLKGVQAAEHILGFKEFVKTAEKDRLNTLQKLRASHSEQGIQTFEKLLPYAIVLGVGEKWAKVFQNIYQEAGRIPLWYTGYDGNFNALRLNDRLNSINSIAASTLTSKPSSSASGGSGFGGGGFSGGGFGGGGGGSW